tara:strand:+ start:446 stop:604 length:159 start_codon:yes stop_codon:yes gene_type:complete
MTFSSLSFEDLIEDMCKDPEFIAQCEKNNREWEEEAAAELGVTVNQLLEWLQ